MPKPRKKKGLATRRVRRVPTSAPKSRPAVLLRNDRRHSSDRGSDQRSDFQRDRDRILYSSAFRRLAGVTQVVHAAEGHIFHNRLTHTLKVAQVGRRLAEYIVQNEPQALIEEVGGIDPSVVETAALAHDLGHPPFGHIAEEELDDQLRKIGVADGYEGNAQSLRIVTKVENPYSKHPGLNLTRASLSAIVKYPWDRAVDGKESRKWGYYYSEKEDFDFARALLPSGDRRQSVEAALMDWSDDVAYSVHDIDDFYRAGLVPLDQLLSGTDERERFITSAFAKWENEGDRTRSKVLGRRGASKFFDELRYWAPGLDSPFSATSSQRVGLNYLSTFLIRRYIVGPDKDTKAITVLDSSSEAFVRLEPILRAEVDLLKELMSYYVFRNPALVGQQFGQRRVVRKLFQVFFEAAQPGSKNSSLIYPPFSDTLKTLDDGDDRERARLVADMIASMTEQQALLLHQRLMGLVPGSIRDLIIR